MERWLTQSYGRQIWLAVSNHSGTHLWMDHLGEAKSSFPEGEVTVFFSVAFLDSPWKCLPSTTAALLGGTAGTLYSNTPTPTPRLADTVGL